MIYVITGCTTSTSYHKHGNFAGGYSEVKVTDEIFYVYYSSPHQIPEKVKWTYLKRRSAEITLDHGFDFFEVIDDTNINSISAGGGYIVIRFQRNANQQTHNASAIVSSYQD